MRIRERVERTAALLDRYYPTWAREDRIDLSKLDMGDGCNCVGGQLARSYGFDLGYSYGAYERFVDQFLKRVPKKIQTELGIEESTYFPAEKVAMSTQGITIWKQEIKKRRGQG